MDAVAPRIRAIARPRIRGVARTPETLAVIRIVACAVMMAVALPAGARSCRAASEPLTRPLVELYTSEGCNSCPPADRWLARHFATLGTRGVALAFHVDYWDRLGWTDRFASPRYTERQYAAMRANGATFVYTPQVLVQGRDVPAWNERGIPAVAAASSVPARATLEFEATPAQDIVGVRAAAVIADAALREGAALFLAYRDSGLHSDVRAGENRGVRLAHDHVVRDLQRAGPPDAQGRITAEFRIVRPREPGSAPTLVAFVQRPNGDVLQTVTLALDACGGS